MRLLTNPLILRAGVVFLAAAIAFVVGFVIMRRMRRSIAEEVSFEDVTPSPEGLPLHTYHAVIQQLKQQKHELQSMRQAEQRRAKTTENISAAVLSNLTDGVVFFDPNGLVRQANAAAKQILGFASLVGMNGKEIFRDANVVSDAPAALGSLAEKIHTALREKTAATRFEGWYVTPAGERRILDITVTPVYTAAHSVLGAACLINDQTEIAHIRKQEKLRSEISAEMALDLRISLNSISGHARQLAANNDPERIRQLAADIASEAAHLDHTIGGFLANANAVHAASGR